MDQIVITVLVAALVVLVASIIKPTIGLLLQPFLRKIPLKMRHYTWKRRIPKGYVGADLMLRFNKNLKIKVLGRDYEVFGLTEYSYRGERSFEFSIIEIEGNIERWLEFDGEEISLWAKWEDKDKNFWKDLGVNGLKRPNPVSLKFCEELLKKESEPSITLVSNDNDKIQARFVDAGFGSNVENLFGGTTETPVPYETEYNWVEAVIEGVKANVNGENKDIYVIFESYSEEVFFNHFSIGIRIKKEDIELK